MSFYGGLFGWQYDARDDYITIEAAGKLSGGIRQPLGNSIDDSQPIPPSSPIRFTVGP